MQVLKQNVRADTRWPDSNTQCPAPYNMMDVSHYFRTYTNSQSPQLGFSGCCTSTKILSDRKSQASLYKYCFCSLFICAKGQIARRILLIWSCKIWTTCDGLPTCYLNWLFGGSTGSLYLDTNDQSRLTIWVRFHVGTKQRKSMISSEKLIRMKR